MLAVSGFFHWKKTIELRAPHPKHDNAHWELKLRKDPQTYKVTAKRDGEEEGGEDG